MIQQKRISQGKLIVLILSLFAIIYVALSLVNHWMFRTYALDLGLYTNALYHYAHFSLSDTSVFNSLPQNLLADHFDLFLPLISPLSFLFGNYTLLLVQIVAVLFGGFGVYRFLQLKNVEEKWTRAGMIYFLLHFSIFSALSYDYHSNVVAACLVPWLFYLAEKRNIAKVWLMLMLILITKENMALWITFVCFGIWLLSKDKKGTHFLLWMSFVSITYFVIVTTVIMPSLSNQNHFVQFKYSVLGNDYKSALKTIFTQPIKVISALFVNTSNQIVGNNVKIESWMFFLFSGGLFLLYRPIWLLMLVPIFMQKFLHDQIQMWGINDQYSIEFAPILAMGIFSIKNNSNNSSVRNSVFVLALIGCSVCTIRLMDRTSSMLRRANVRVYQASHWRSEMNTKAINEAMRLIPANASVTAQSNILPHLAWRNKIYSLPLINDAEYIIYEKEKETYPLDKINFKAFSDSLENSQSWEKLLFNENVVLLKRNLPK